MKYIKAILLSTLLYPCISHAAIFDFSYLFQAGYGDDRGIEPTLVTGSFFGEQDGNFVKNITGIEVSIQGRKYSDNLISVLYSVETGSAWDFSQEGAVSFDVALNNFMFVNGTYATEGPSNHFSIINYPDGNSLRQADNSNGGYSYGFDNDSLSNDSWSLIEREVPEPSILILLASGLAITAIRRVKKLHD